MSRLALRLQRIWYDREPVPFWLAALVPVYRLLRAAHLALYRSGLRTVARVDVPVVVVGNLTAGGSGKTPLVIALVEALRARGFRPAIVSRGYGGSQRAATVLEDAPDPRRYGDEASLMRRRTGAMVAVGRNRARAVALLAQRGANVVIADDGLQNPGLARDIEICVIDGQRRFGNERRTKLMLRFQKRPHRCGFVGQSWRVQTQARGWRARNASHPVRLSYVHGSLRG